MWIRIKGYYPCSTFEVTEVKKQNKPNFKYFRFSSPVNSKKIFEFYKEEMQQGYKPYEANMGRTIIAQTGFFERGYKHWNEFKQFHTQIVYRFEKIDDKLLEIDPLNIKDSEQIEESMILDL